MGLIDSPKDEELENIEFKFGRRDRKNSPRPVSKLAHPTPEGWLLAVLPVLVLSVNHFKSSGNAAFPMA
jgi:hypothetical protein